MNTHTLMVTCQYFALLVADNRISMSSEISEEQKQDIKEWFDICDTDKDGKLAKEEIATLLRVVGNNPTEDDITRIFTEVDTDGTGLIDVEEFQAYYVKNIANVDEKQTLIEAINSFDKNNDGFIQRDELMKFMKDLSEEQAQGMLDMADKNGDGKVDIEEFVELMMAM
ncbi:calmodulin-like [Mytilus edulis]|uniref:calmodulin-like n=1 Tax=Mytilus edulis TaxID=6550 RepID=UPI0039EE8FFE